MRQGYCILLERQSDLQVVGQARDGQEAVDLARQLGPDIITMDINMPRLDGLRATQLIRTRSDSPHVVVVTGLWDADRVRRALDVGADGLVAKTDAFQELPTAIRAVYRGERYFSRALSTWSGILGLGTVQ